MSQLTENLQPREIDFLKFQKTRGVDAKTAFSKLQLARNQGKFEEKKPGILERIGSKLGERGEKIGEALTRERTTAEVLIPGAGFPIEVVGQLAGGLGDIIGEGAIAGFKALGKGLSAITPDFIEDPIKEAVGDAGTALLQSEAGQKGIQALQSGVEGYIEFKKGNPITARKLEALGNIISVAPIGRLAKPATTIVAKGVGVPGKALVKSAAKTTAKRTDKFITNLVAPTPTKKQSIQDILKGKVKEGGVISGRTRAPDIVEQSIKQEVLKVPGIGADKTLLQNNNAILNQIGKLDDKLLKSLGAKPVLIPRRETKAVLHKVKKELAENPLLVGDAEKTAAKILNKFETIVDSNPGNARGLLKSRRELDSWIKRQKPNAFSGDKEDALTIALKAIRTTANDLVDAKVKDVPVKALLRSQSNLFRALENIAPKAAKEAGSKLGRLGQSIQKKLGFKGEVLSAVGLVGGTALIPGFLTVLGTVGAGTLAAKGIVSPGLRRFLGKALTKAEKLLKSTPGNPDLQAIKSEINEFLDDNK